MVAASQGLYIKVDRLLRPLDGLDAGDARRPRRRRDAGFLGFLQDDRVADLAREISIRHRLRDDPEILRMRDAADLAPEDVEDYVPDGIHKLDRIPQLLRGTDPVA